MRVCLVDVCWPYERVLNKVMFVGLVDMCCPFLKCVGFVFVVLALELHVGLGDAC